jgi:hypothetical protein
VRNNKIRAEINELETKKNTKNKKAGSLKK